MPTYCQWQRISWQNLYGSKAPAKRAKIKFRADYWVSQNRKYCDFCKCWITDNKPSVDFHEKGRRHQENVKKKLRNITRQSTKVQRDSDKIDATLKRMEVAAFAAYKKDIESGNDLSSAIIKQNMKHSPKLWHETKTRDGKSYFVNIMTKETVWKPPAEGFLSLQEQRELADNEAQKQLKAVEKYKQKEALLTMQRIQQEEAEEAARKAREKLKERRVDDVIGPSSCGPLLEPGKIDPYGKWQTVKESSPMDLQLPTLDRFDTVQLEFEPEPVQKEFKEKTIGSLDCGETTFKKRKLGVSSKRNIRQQLDDY